MSHYDWKTEMRASDRGTGPDGLTLGPRTDKLHGQAAAIFHDDGRVTLTVMPDAGCFPAQATISADDARQLRRILTGRDLTS